MNETTEKQLKDGLFLLKNIRITIVFIVSYVVVNTVYLVIFRQYVYDYWAIFLTSPFNLLENFSKSYTSPFQGLLANFLLVALIILLCELYTRSNAVNIKKVGISFDGVFALSIVSSYITSAFWWWYSGLPSHGTSIIGFCLLLWTFFECILDFRFYWRLPEQSMTHSLRKITWLVFFFISIIVASTFVLENPSYPIHLFGAFVFVALAFFALVFIGESGRVGR